MGAIARMKEITAISTMPHAVCIPYPAQGHINPMLKLAKLLHSKGFHITFVNTEYNHRRLLESRGPNALDGLPHFRFETIPDGLEAPSGDHKDDENNATQDIPALCYSTSRTCLVPFRNLLAKLNNDANIDGEHVSPPVSCVVSDGVMSFTLTAAEELGVPEILFWTTSACGFMGYVHFPHLVQRRLAPLKDENHKKNGYLETLINWIPGMKNIRLKDLPSFIQTTDPNDLMLNFVLAEIERASKASAIILNTFDALEADVIEAMKSLLPPPIYTIGSLHLLLQHISKTHLIKSIGSNLWKEETQCLQWLDSKPPNSVVYVNFGSITIMTPQQLIEFAWGLANSDKSFLWVIRPDLVAGDSAILPPEFLSRTKERSMLASWCPQEDVIRHSSIGGFLTHSGWNSTIESICSGVPMICWPFFAEQQMNCKYCCDEWGIGMEIGGEVLERDEVERLVRELMDGEEGKKMKMKAMEWKKMAEEAAAAHGGSSYVNLDKLVRDVLINNEKIIS